MEVKNLLIDTVERLRGIAMDTESRHLRTKHDAIMNLADDLYEKSKEFDPEFVKVCSSEYPEEGHCFISKEDYALSPGEWTILA